MNSYKPLFVFILFICFITPNLIQIIQGAEHFPFSNNPMFGHSIAKTDTLAAISFLKETGESREELDLSAIGLWDVRLKRFYFSNVYGSSEVNSPQKNASASPEEFISNNKIFFKKLSQLISDRGEQIPRIFLEVSRISPDGEVVERKAIGYYDNKLDDFVLL